MSSTTHMLKVMPSRSEKRPENEEGGKKAVATETPETPGNSFTPDILALCLTPGKNRQELIP